MVPQITADHHAAMERDGFVVFEDVFSPEEMRELEAMVATFQEEHEARLRAEGASGISRPGEISFTDHIAEQDAGIRAFCERPEFVEMCREFLGPDVDLYWNQTVYKQPEAKREFPWHQDDGYTAVDPSPYLTLWLAISDATEENGCISVLPGSHKRGLVPHWGSEIGWVCHSADDPDQGILVPVKAGSVIAFWSLTMHKSGPNVSKGTRKAYVIQYAKKGIRPVDGEPFVGLIPIVRDGVAA